MPETAEAEAPKTEREPDRGARGAPEGGAGVKGVVTKKIGPLPAWAWAIGLGLAGLFFLKHKKASSAAQQPVGSQDFSSDPGGDINGAANGSVLSQLQQQLAALQNQVNATGAPPTTAPTSGPPAPKPPTPTPVAPQQPPPPTSGPRQGPLGIKSTGPIHAGTFVSNGAVSAPAVQPPAQKVNSPAVGPTTPGAVTIPKGVDMISPPKGPGSQANPKPSQGPDMISPPKGIGSQAAKVAPKPAPTPKAPPRPAPKPAPKPVANKSKGQVVGVQSASKVGTRSF